MQENEPRDSEKISPLTDAQVAAHLTAVYDRVKHRENRGQTIMPFIASSGNINRALAEARRKRAALTLS